MRVAAELIACEFIFLAIICGVLIHYYRSPVVTFDVSLTVYLSWVLGFSAVLLLPYDLSLAIEENLQSANLEKLWSWVYWVTFILAWVVLPYQMEYHKSGHFTIKEKLWDAFAKLGIALLIVFVLGMIYIIYTVVSKGSITQVMGFAMAMSNTYGVLLITVLMGSGMVGLPKRLWSMGDREGELRRLYLSAEVVEDAYHQARYELESCEQEVIIAISLLDALTPSKQSQTNPSTHSQTHPRILEIQALESNLLVLKEKMNRFLYVSSNLSKARKINASSSSATTSTTSPSGNNKDFYLNKKNLVLLHSKLMHAQLKLKAYERRWRLLVANCQQYQEILQYQTDHLWCAMPVTSTTSPSISTTTSFYRWWYNLIMIRLYLYVCRFLSIVCGIMSLIVLWCEITMATSLPSPMGELMAGYVSAANSDTATKDWKAFHPILIQSIAFLFLMYMSMCTYWLLFRLKFGYSYRLQGPQLSSPYSLIFNGEYLSRLQFALGYNFLLALNIQRTNRTAFISLMENIEIIPVFGTSFTVYVPILMSIIALITLFDGFSRICRMLGIESEDTWLLIANEHKPSVSQRHGQSPQLTEAQEDSHKELLEKLQAGQAIVNNELKQMNKQLQQLQNQQRLPSSSSSANPTPNSSIHGLTDSQHGLASTNTFNPLSSLGVNTISIKGQKGQYVSVSSREEDIDGDNHLHAPALIGEENGYDIELQQRSSTTSSTQNRKTMKSNPPTNAFTGLFTSLFGSNTNNSKVSTVNQTNPTLTTTSTSSKEEAKLPKASISLSSTQVKLPGSKGLYVPTFDFEGDDEETTTASEKEDMNDLGPSLYFSSFNRPSTSLASNSVPNIQTRNNPTSKPTQPPPPRPTTSNNTNTTNISNNTNTIKPPSKPTNTNVNTTNNTNNNSINTKKNINKNINTNNNTNTSSVPTMNVQDLFSSLGLDDEMDSNNNIPRGRYG